MKKQLHLLFFILLLLNTTLLKAQPFTNLNSGFPTLGGAAVDWADYDNDNDLDFALTGFSGVTAEVSRIYRNDGNGIFTCVDSTLTEVSSGSVSWGDYDNDGDPDLLLSGQTGTGLPAATSLYRNDGNDVFTLVPTGIVPIIGTSRWIDFDNDGWLDVILAGLGNTLTNDSTRLFHNNGDGTFTEFINSLPGYFATEIAIADFDNDGDSDFFITGGTLSSSTFPVCRLYSNDGTGNFTLVPFNFINLSTGTAAWGDYDNDGDQDLLYDGIDSTFSLGSTLLYRNDNGGNFTLMNVGLPGTGEPGSVDWGDMDNDGDLDILLGGTTYVLRNDGNNVFTDITQEDMVYGVPNTFADIDQDGDLDILVIQIFGGFYASTIFRNDLVATGIHQPLKNEQAGYLVSADNGILTVTSLKRTNAPVSFELFDIAGRKIIAAPLNFSAAETFTLPLPDISAGIFIYRIKSTETDEADGKLILE